jgi:hypothetical protein
VRRSAAAHRNKFRCAVHEWSDFRTDYAAARREPTSSIRSPVTRC